MFIVLLIGVLNLGLGFVAAIHLGYGPPSLSAAWQAWTGDGRAVANRGGLAATGKQGSPGGGDSDADNPKVSDLGFDDEDLGSLLDMDEDEDFLDESTHDEPSGDGEDSSSEGDGEEDGPNTTVDSGSLVDWELDDKYIETSVLKLNIAMMKSGARAMDLDLRLRSSRGNSEAEALKKIAAQLKEDCETYLAEQEEAGEKLRERFDEFGEFGKLAEGIEMGSMEQAAQIETTLNNLALLDFDSDPEEANSRLLEELSKLREARHTLRDSQDVAFLTIAKHEERVDKIPKQVFNDELTGLRSRIGLESTLADWWGVSKHQKHQMSAALFDLDRFGSINGKHGPAASDKILVQIARLMESRCGTGDLLGRHAGQRFLLVTVDKGPRTATKDAEFLRQTVERITFEHAGVAFSLSMCGGYTEIRPDDTVETFIQRLEAALARAKKSGPNHGSFHDGREAEIVESPNLGAEYRDVKLDKHSTFPGK